MAEAEEVSVGEFARLSRLSPKALRLYDRMGLLVPQRVDEDTGYRRYGRAQLDRALLVASLRQVGIPLGEIRLALAAEGGPSTALISEFWAEAEAEHAARRRLVGLLLDRLEGRETGMSTAYQVKVRELPSRNVLSLTRHVVPAELLTVGREFAVGFREAGVDPHGGAAGAPFTIYYGEVSEDSDGPIEWCWPVAQNEAEQRAADFPDLDLRTDPEHQEAYVHYGRATQLHQARIVLAMQSLYGWAREQERRPSGPVRLVYRTGASGEEPEVDVVLPIRPMAKRTGRPGASAG